MFLVSLYDRSSNQTDTETINFFEGLSDKCDDIRNNFNVHYKEWLITEYKHCWDWLAVSLDLNQIVSDFTFECRNSRGIHILDLYSRKIYLLLHQIYNIVKSSVAL